MGFGTWEWGFRYPIRWEFGQGESRRFWGSLFSNKTRLSSCSRWRCSCKWGLIRLAWGIGISCCFFPCVFVLCVDILFDLLQFLLLWLVLLCSFLILFLLHFVVIASCFPLRSQSCSTLTRSNWATWREHKNPKQMHVKSWIFVKTRNQTVEGSVYLVVMTQRWDSKCLFERVIPMVFLQSITLVATCLRHVFAIWGSGDL